MNIHATTVRYNNIGYLLSGPPGSGKSDLALRLINEGAQLVADDQTHLSIEQNVLVATPPQTLAGLLEVRGLGILKLPFLPKSPLDVAISLESSSQIERMPKKSSQDFLGVALPVFSLDPFCASAPNKILMIGQIMSGQIELL